MTAFPALHFLFMFWGIYIQNTPKKFVSMEVATLRNPQQRGRRVP